MGVDCGQFIEFVEVDEETVAGHFVDGFVVAQRAVVFGDDAGVRS